MARFNAENFTYLEPKVPYFFISQEKFNFAHFLAKFELVSKSAVFFFPAPEKKNSLLRLSQSVRYKLFQEKKKTKKKQLLEKKKNRYKISKTGKRKILVN